MQQLANITQLFNVDRLSWVLIGLVAFVAISVGSFSIRYLKGDRRQGAFFANLVLLVLSVFVMVCADHILVLLLSWGISNTLLTRLMLHKRDWEAARQSSILALKNFGLGFVFLGAALVILYTATGQTSIQAILSQPIGSQFSLAAGVFLLLAAMTQSALWPFHRWLISSLNSPTPVSAIMHAGLVNGGGFLLTRFAPIFVSEPALLNVVFAAGILTAVVGTLWKLMQHDVKRMLACSTMGQMGFMIAQCGLGLFPAAVAHLCWHGLFKAYSFLATGSAAREKRLDLDYPPTVGELTLSIIFGLIAACMFSLTSGKLLLLMDTNLFLTFLAAIAGAQFALPVLRGTAKAKFLLALLGAFISGTCYGFSVYFIEYIVEPLGLSTPQPLNMLHLVAAVLLLSSWLGMLFARPSKKGTYNDWMLKQYVRTLNASQPHPGTITANRNKYQF